MGWKKDGREQLGQRAVKGSGLGGQERLLQVHMIARGQGHSQRSLYVVHLLK